MIDLYLGDCLEIMPTLAAASVDAVICDPPYGIDLGSRSGGPRSGLAESRTNYHVLGDDRPFDPAPLLRFKVVVLFGANHYAQKLPASGAWIVWDKLDGLQSKRDIGFNDNSDCELIWTNVGNAARIMRHRWMGAMKASEHNQRRVHPTQKPVELMAQIVRHYTKPGDTILDPFMGSGSTGVAAIQEGRNFIGIEREPSYYAIAEQRIQAAAASLRQLEVFA